MQILLFPSVLGVRPGITDAAARMSGAGHAVTIVDLWGGDVYDSYEPAMARAEATDDSVLYALADEAADRTSGPLVVAGFSMGGALVEHVALTRPCAGALMLACANSLRWFAPEGAPTPAWPGSTPVQVHYALGDPFREQDELDAFAGQVRASGAAFEMFDYPGDGHLFTDESLPAEYDPGPSGLLWERVLPWLAALGS